MAFVPRACTADPEAPSESTRADFALMAADDADLHNYWRLAVETARHFVELERKLERNLAPHWFNVEDGHRAIERLAYVAPAEDNSGLTDRWRSWDDRYRVILAQSPKWRLKLMIGRLSETHALRSWPKRWGRDVWVWAMADDDVICPFADRRGWIDPAFRQRLRQTIEEAGGFLHHCEKSGHIVFAPTADLERVWQHQDRLAALDRAKPFGFFYDASRPDFRMRKLTAQEEFMRAAIKARVPGSRPPRRPHPVNAGPARQSRFTLLRVIRNARLLLSHDPTGRAWLSLLSSIMSALALAVGGIAALFYYYLPRVRCRLTDGDDCAMRWPWELARDDLIWLVLVPGGVVLALLAGSFVLRRIFRAGPRPR